MRMCLGARLTAGPEHRSEDQSQSGQTSIRSVRRAARTRRRSHKIRSIQHAWPGPVLGGGREWIAGPEYEGALFAQRAARRTDRIEIERTCGHSADRCSGPAVKRAGCYARRFLRHPVADFRDSPRFLDGVRVPHRALPAFAGCHSMLRNPAKPGVLDALPRSPASPYGQLSVPRGTT